MSAHDVKLFGDQIAASRLEDRFAQRQGEFAAAAGDRGSVSRPHRAGLELRRRRRGAAAHGSRDRRRRRLSIFVDTGQHFPETLAYRDELCESLGLTNVIVAEPGRRDARRRKTRRSSCSPAIPTAAARSARCGRSPRRWMAIDAWITGRKGFQSVTRAPPAAVRSGRASGSRSTRWSAGARATFSTTSRDAGLPRHPLVAKGFPSIGCLPCTSPVKPGEDERAGRWRGRGKSRMRHPHRSRSTRERTSDAAVAARRLCRRRMDLSRGRRAGCRTAARSSFRSSAGSRRAKRWRRAPLRSASRSQAGADAQAHLAELAGSAARSRLPSPSSPTAAPSPMRGLLRDRHGFAANCAPSATC